MSMNDKDRTQTRIAAYLIGTRGDAVLLGKRQNTGHMDGCWSLIAGHVREKEPCTQAIIREFEEECGVKLKPEELTLIGAMHHNSPPYDYVNFIFHVDLTHHVPQNLEPHKCAILEFHDAASLPKPMEKYIIEIIQKSIPYKGLWVSECGWSYQD